MSRINAFHDAKANLAPAASIKAQSISAASVYGNTVDLASKRGVYFAVTVGNVTDPTNATWACYLQESDVDSNGNFTNVNTTTWPDATIAAANTANTTGEMAYDAGPGRKQYVRAVAVTVSNAALMSVVGVKY